MMKTVKEFWEDIKKQNAKWEKKVGAYKGNLLVLFTLI